MRNFKIAAIAAGAAFTGAGFWGAGSARAAESDATSCVKGADIRVIEVIAPGEVGAACDLKYTREAGLNVSVPFHANSDPAFCSAKARDVVDGLKASGFLCAAGATPMRATSQAAAPDQAPDQAPEQVPAPMSEPAPPFPVVAASVVAADVASQNEGLAAPAAASPQPAPQTAATATVDAPAQSAPPVTQPAAPEGPVVLTANARLPQTRAQRPSTAGAGRLRGATPTLLAGASGDAAAMSAGVRPAEDVIKGVLAAQAAAWNENDLDGFLAAYWQSPAARFVAGGEIVTGFDAIAASYRSTYGASGSLGKLALTDLSVQPVTDDVATVVGRFRLDNAKGVETGVYTLVMRKVEGRWRIAHDHSVIDAKAP